MAHDLTIKTAGLAAKLSRTTVIYAAEGPKLSGEGEKLWEQTGLGFSQIADAARFQGKPGQLLDIPAPANIAADRLFVAGAGKPDDATASTPAGYRDRGGSLVAKLRAAKADEVSVIVDGLSDDAVADLATGMCLRNYGFDKYKTVKPDEKGSNGLAITLHVVKKAAVDKAIADRMATVEGTLLARDLVNEPSNLLGPVEFADAAAALSEFGVEVEVLTPEDMEKLGMGALLGVAQGSARPARMVVMQWAGGAKSDAPVAFVGKGVVFDTGGISLKRSPSMEAMKGDMGGAAAVAGLMKTIALRKAKANVVGVIGIVENMPGGNAYRPGDILTSMSGQTIEVINTDAEGRLVLADALWYTRERFKPKFMVDLATLTGAILAGFAHEYAGLFSNDDDLSGNLFASGMASGEKVWRMPMGAAYDKLIDSRFADVKNSGGALGGAITAAQFLHRFVKETPWAHLDIAGTAFGAPSSETNASWATGFGVALLDRMMRDYYEG